ncbi:MAG: TrmH family RNA methyltransferase [Lachnospiraceae bacterium]
MITSTANTKIKQLLKIMKKSKERTAAGEFIAEGMKMFEEAPKDAVKEVYVSESFTKNQARGSEWRRFPHEILSDRVFECVSDTKTPQGILTVIKTHTYSPSQFYLSQNGCYLFLENIQDPGNLGTMIRTGEGAGISGIIISRDSADPYQPKTIRSTMGSIYRVPILIAEDFILEVENARAMGICIYAAHLEGSRLYDSADYRGSCGFLIGNEGNGLTDEAVAGSDDRIRIPMSGQVESLNAAIAATVLMYEMNRQRR